MLKINQNKCSLKQLLYPEEIVCTITLKFVSGIIFIQQTNINGKKINLVKISAPKFVANLVGLLSNNQFELS